MRKSANAPRGEDMQSDGGNHCRDMGGDRRNGYGAMKIQPGREAPRTRGQLGGKYALRAIAAPKRKKPR